MFLYYFSNKEAYITIIGKLVEKEELQLKIEIRS